jgi:hypothetical protein
MYFKHNTNLTISNALHQPHFVDGNIMVSDAIPAIWLPARLLPSTHKKRIKREISLLCHRKCYAINTQFS